MNKNAKIFVAGHLGLVGSALVRQLKKQGFEDLIFQTRDELDLLDNIAVQSFFEKHKPEYVFLAAAKVGGIYANNTYPADFIHDNLVIQSNVIHQSYLNNVKRLLFLGSSCIYPKNSAQPLKEESLLTGELEETNRPYALAKIAGIEMCWSYNRQYGTQFLAAMPTNLFGPGDNYDLTNSHVLPALIRKFHLAKLAFDSDIDSIKQDETRYGKIPEKLKQNLLQSVQKQSESTVTIWGTGVPRREFMYSEDMAEACLFLMNLPDAEYGSLTADNRNNGIAPIVNVGIGEDISIKDLAYLVADIVGFEGKIVFDIDQPDGTAQKLMSISRLESFGWQKNFDLKERITHVYNLYKQYD